MKKSGGRGQEASAFEDSASKFYLFCDKASLSSSASSSSSSADSVLSTSTLTSTSTDDDSSAIGFEGRRNSMRHRKGRLRHPSDPGTPHSRLKPGNSSMAAAAARKRTVDGNTLNISRMDVENEENHRPDDVTPNNSPSKVGAYYLRRMQRKLV